MLQVTHDILQQQVHSELLPMYVCHYRHQMRGSVSVLGLQFAFADMSLVVLEALRPWARLTRRAPWVL